MQVRSTFSQSYHPRLGGSLAFLGLTLATERPRCRQETHRWRAWRLAVKFDPTTADHMIFGDYAADCSKMDFAKGGGRPIPHLRYTTGENWRIERGANDGTGRDRMHPVYTEIVDSNDFAGAGFSEADRYIARAAASAAAPHGNPSTWRQLNTTHHITQVVSDIARVRGFEIKRPSIEESVQNSLLPEI